MNTLDPRRGSGFVYYGGPLDGAEVPKSVVKEGFSLVSRQRVDGSYIVYTYMKCETHPWFEYTGEFSEEEDSE